MDNIKPLLWQMQNQHMLIKYRTKYLWLTRLTQINFTLKSLILFILIYEREPKKETPIPMN